MKIADHEIGPHKSVFIQVEAGVTTMGDLARTFEMIEAAAAAGADAFKGIVTNPAKVERRPDRLFGYSEIRRTNAFGSLVAPHEVYVARPIGDLMRETMFTFEEWRKIRDFCHERKLVFYATADHLDAVDMLEALDVPAHKICAWDLTYYPLLDKMIETRKPIIIDIGTATTQELFQIQHRLLRNTYDKEWAMPRPACPNGFLFVHSPHPRGLKDWNLRRMRLSYIWGFSSPDRESWCDYAALGLGAVLLEKRMTLRRDEPRGHHHAISLEPDEFKDWVKGIRQAEAALAEEPWAGSSEAWQDRATNDRQEDGLRA